VNSLKGIGVVRLEVIGYASGLRRGGYDLGDIGVGVRKESEKVGNGHRKHY
jgi:hypothetical protein